MDRKISAEEIKIIFETQGYFVTVMSMDIYIDIREHGRCVAIIPMKDGFTTLTEAEIKQVLVEIQ